MIYAIVGPTCSGKTNLANQLSDVLGNAPIINCDAFQIYKDMNIGTAKLPTISKYYGRYHLIDIVSPSYLYSVAEYQNDFRKCIDELLKTNQHIIICGGTGLYLRSALYDYTFEEGVDDTSDLEAMDSDSLYKMLLALDPIAAEGIHPNNRKRVIRAISIARTLSKNKSENIENQNHEILSQYRDIKIFFINPDRESLYERINQRVDLMIKEGLAEEVKSLLDKYQLSITARQAIGYKEIIDYLDEKNTLEEAIELIKKRTRNYAKRQVTFFKHQFDTIELKSADFKELLENL